LRFIYNICKDNELMAIQVLNLNFGIIFEELYNYTGLVKVDKAFCNYLAARDQALSQDLSSWRDGAKLPQKESSALIISLAQQLEAFLQELFQLDVELLQKAQKTHHEFALIYQVKRNFIQRKIAKNSEAVLGISSDILAKQLHDMGCNTQDSASFAQFVITAQEEKNEHNLKLAADYATWALFTDEGKEKHKDDILYKIPKKTDPQNLIKTVVKTADTWQGIHQHNRNGFDRTDIGIELKEALDNANYCIYCHNQGKDSCAHGMREKTSGAFISNTHKVELTGCPLEEHISEMNYLKANGWVLGAFAAVTINNPMVAATGDRICNDCMKACIYQKQDPVDIPKIETRVLQDVLDLPWGFEIYSLLTRWNPLRAQGYLPKPASGHKVLVAGLGPAGFTLAHYLLNEGFDVVAIDGLKIEPLPAELRVVDIDTQERKLQPIKFIKDFFEPLSKRKAYGFGGVAEYGITVRWEKNFLTVIRLLLERRANFRMHGGVRFGGTVTYEDAKNLGFDHIALCLGAGRPNMLNIPNRLAKGVRMASDFLMALQLTGAARQDNLANLQVRLPIVVVGGGLTAIDTATESLAYYAQQVEKLLRHYEELNEEIFANLSAREKRDLEEMLQHARELRAHPKDKLKLLQSWGGVTIAYRRSLQESPSYRLNHEEVAKAFEEGILFKEHITPLAFELDADGWVNGIRHKDGLIPASTVLIAAGTHPNTVLAREDSEHFTLDEKYFQAVDSQGNKVKPEATAKPQRPYVLTNVNEPSVSFFGDMHPSFSGNVVKAMSSAKQGHPIISDLLQKQKPRSPLSKEEFFQQIEGALTARVVRVNRLTPTIVEVVVKAPLAAHNFQPGQFYRLQNFEVNAKRTRDLVLAMEGMAMTGAWVDRKEGLLSTIVLEMGGSSSFCQLLQPGEQIVLMGPTGTPTEIPQDQTILLIGGGLGNAVLFSIGKAMRENGCRVLYFAGYKKAQDRYKVEEIEAAADEIVWCCDEELLSVNREQDSAFQGNIVEALLAYAQGLMDENQGIKLAAVDRMIAIGSDFMMKAVAYARHNQLKQYFKQSLVSIGSINSPMQCMMKEICAQCLQRHMDPQTGEESYVYSCFNQDQSLETVDFDHLHDRLQQNNMQEKISAKIIRNCLYG
jgi:NADPH-dependent glutamate synthase beta subunit-like oxidoreductase/NAD(P)H-flavin reductase